MQRPVPATQLEVHGALSLEEVNIGPQARGSSGEGEAGNAPADDRDASGSQFAFTDRPQ
jgi:hypothetical protein